jgi:hypothetical protein
MKKKRNKTSSLMGSGRNFLMPAIGMAAVVSILGHTAAIKPARDSVVETVEDAVDVVHNLATDVLSKDGEKLDNVRGEDTANESETLNDVVKDIDHYKAQTAPIKSSENARQTIYPQSEQEKLAVQQKITDRLNRIDLKALNEYRRNAFVRLTKKEFIGVNELYPTLESFYGVPNEAVDGFKQKIQTRIQNLKLKLKDDFSDEFIREVVEDRYAESIYTWGQASCVDFENSGFYNCVSMAMDMHLIFEGLLKSLSEDVQKKWVIGSIFED